MIMNNVKAISNCLNTYTQIQSMKILFIKHIKLENVRTLSKVTKNLYVKGFRESKEL